MRVIAGSAKGMKLKTSKGLTVRPTADRVREALFNILGPGIAGTICLDLYAGSGAVGIEALSRGAGCCVFVDWRKDNISLIRENLTKTRLMEKARLIRADAEIALHILACKDFKADLIFLDPPYNYSAIQPIVCSIFSHRLLHKDGLVIVEHDCKNQQWIGQLPVTRQKRYGDTCLTFIVTS